MDVLWPGFLILLLFIPLLVGLYIWVLRRRRRYAVRFSSLALLRAALPERSNLRRHLPFALFLIAVSSLIVALARPAARVTVPAGQSTVILAMDVSLSMCSVDIPPNRLEAAKEAAGLFVGRQDANTQLGIVAFAGFAALVQPPTNDQEVLQDVIDNLETARRTAIGSAILVSLDAIAEINPNVAPSTRAYNAGEAPEPVPEGSYVPDIIVLLTDGASNTGPWPLDAAQQAADRGVRVYTIGYGTANGAAMDCGDFYWSGRSFGGGGGMFGGFRRGIDEQTLREIADLTGGEYYSAESAAELQDVFRSLPTHLITREETMEISVFFVALGALLAALAVGLSMLWNPLT